MHLVLFNQSRRKDIVSNSILVLKEKNKNRKIVKLCLFINLAIVKSVYSTGQFSLWNPDTHPKLCYPVGYLAFSNWWCSQFQPAMRIISKLKRTLTKS